MPMKNKRIAGVLCIVVAIIGFVLYDDTIVRLGLTVVAGIGLGLLMSKD